MDEITVGIVSWYEADLISNLVSNMLDKTSTTSRLRFLICDNTNGKDTSLYEKLGDQCTIIPNDQGDISAVSYGHAKGLSRLLANVSTDLCLFSDPDCMVLMKDWDVVCKASLSGKVIAVGAPYPPTMINKCHGFPVAYFVLFDASTYREMGVDWSPRGTSKLMSAKDFVLRNTARALVDLTTYLFGAGFFLTRWGRISRAVFGCSSKDTGWKVTKKLLDSGYAGKLFETALCPKQIHSAFASIEEVLKLAAEFQLFLWGGYPIVTHLYSTRCRYSFSQTLDYWKSLADSVAQAMEASSADRHLVESPS